MDNFFKNNNYFDYIIKEAKKYEKDPSRFLKKELLIQSYNDFIKIQNIKIKNRINKSFETCCVIAFKGRHKITELNVSLLSRQSLRPAVVLVASNYEDLNFGIKIINKYDNTYLTLSQNYPIGGKWYAGVKFAQSLGVRGLMILGSDDLLSLEYFKNCYQAIGSGNGSRVGSLDLIGSRRWYIYNTSQKLYSLHYKDEVPICLGGGRMFSKFFLDSCNWEIFRKYRPIHLDAEGFNKVKDFSNKIGLISDEDFILSIKGPWEVINSTERILSSANRVGWSEDSKNIETISKKLGINNINDYIR